jgi:hypothetical protein
MSNGIGQVRFAGLSNLNNSQSAVNNKTIAGDLKLKNLTQDTISFKGSNGPTKSEIQAQIGALRAELRDLKPHERGRIKSIQGQIAALQKAKQKASN